MYSKKITLILSTTLALGHAPQKTRDDKSTIANALSYVVATAPSRWQLWDLPCLSLKCQWTHLAIKENQANRSKARDRQRLTDFEATKTNFF